MTPMRECFFSADVPLDLLMQKIVYNDVLNLLALDDGDGIIAKHVKDTELCSCEAIIAVKGWLDA